MEIPMAFSAPTPFVDDPEGLAVIEVRARRDPRARERFGRRAPGYPHGSEHLGPRA